MTEPLVQVRGLTKIFDVSAPWLERWLQGLPRQRTQAVRDLSFTLAKGSTLALVGESGCGKSTVARLLVGLLAPTQGQVRFDGQDLQAALRSANAPQLRRRMQMIFQDPYASLNPRWRVGRIVAEPLDLMHMAGPAHERHARVAALLESVGLAAADMSKFPHQFSGGQRQRVSIARALATEPEFIVCDEPTSALDVSVQAQVLNLMRDLQQRRGLTYLFISHNLAVVRHMADEVGVMYLGSLVEWAPKATLFRSPRHPYTRMLMDAIPDLHKIDRPQGGPVGEVPTAAMSPPSGCAFHPRCRLANARCHDEVPVLALVDGTRVACHAVSEGRD
jgi:peptide/nickel transport system ATP-binding protein